MRARVLLVSAATAIVVAYLLRTVGGSGPSDRPVPPVRVPAPLTTPGEPSVLPAPLRNVFEYAEGAPRPTPLVAPVAVAPMAPAMREAAPGPSATPAVRLVGLLRRGAQLKVALAVAGETMVLAPGESAGGYTVLSIDEEEGVRVRTPEGTTVVLGGGSED